MTAAQFQKLIWGYYKQNRRQFPWRETHDPYKILVSEIMLQQTQTFRVVPKYEEFLEAFPDFNSLAKAPLDKVLRHWLGLGYNRRAVNLKKTAEIIVKDYGGKFPKEYEKVLELPGIGPGSAGAVLAFAFNLPIPFIETNIRSVFIHFFFASSKSDEDEFIQVHDKEIMPLIEKTLDKKNPREWYYALYDYGAMLKNTIGNPNKKSVHYKRQSPFKGSNREARSLILKEILRNGKIKENEKSKKNLEAMRKEGTLRKSGLYYFIEK